MKRKRWPRRLAAQVVAIVSGAFAFSFLVPATAGAAPAGTMAPAGAVSLQVRSEAEIRAMAADGAGKLFELEPKPGAAARSGPGASPDSDIPFDIIICILDLTNPSGGGFPTNPVGVDAIVVCSDWVDFATLRLRLFRDRGLVASERLTFPFTFGVALGARTPTCFPGSYEAVAEAEVTRFDAFPPTAIAVIGSGPVQISCGATIPTPPPCQVNPNLCA